MPADLADQAANVGCTLGPLGAPRRAQQRSDETTVPVKDDDGLEAIFVIEGIEQAQLLLAMHRVECVVDIEHDLARCPLCQGSCPPLYFSSISQVGGIGQ